MAAIRKGIAREPKPSQVLTALSHTCVNCQAVQKMRYISDTPEREYGRVKDKK